MKKVLAFLAVAIASAAFGQIPPPGERRPNPEQLIRQFDRNSDGKISRDEAPPRMRDRWEQIDTDHDGFITLEELRARDARVAGMESRGSPAVRVQPDANAKTVATAIPGTRAYVNAANTAGAHDGKTWATAFTTLQEALAHVWHCRS